LENVYHAPVRIGVFVAKLEETPPATSPLFTETERGYCLARRNPAPHLAGRFAAKRAACIALGVREEEAQRLVSDFEVVREPGRAPTLHFVGAANGLLEPGAKSHVSISHSGNYAVALVVIE
jgi:holo-[acyl-carrier protein] synthase